MLFDPLCIMVSAVGIYMLFRLRFFFLFHPIKTLKKLKSSFKGGESFKSLMLALAGTLGIGNIFGVSLGIIMGGAGSVFWMLVSAVFASVIKYSEIVIANDNHRHPSLKTRGSMFYTLSYTFPRIGNYLAILYASACLFLSLSMGVGLQVGAVSEATGDLFNTPPIVIGLIATLIFAFSVNRGVGKIEKITAVAIPMTTVLYIFVAVSAIAVNIERLDDAILLIVSDAFNSSALSGGIIGFLFSRGVREGYSKGILSNEAGTGTSTMAHSRSGILNPSTLGIRGILEVFFDTVVLCMLTALAILTSSVDVGSFSDGMPLILAAITSSLGGFSGALILVSVAFFAYATVVCWYYYGSECACFLLGRCGKIWFLPFYLAFALLSPLIGNRVLASVTDVLIIIMTVLTLSVIIKKSDRIVVLSENGGVLPARKLKIKGILSKR